MTAIIDVLPVTPTISINGLAPGDQTAILQPGTQTPADTTYATMNLTFPGSLPTGSTVTLSVDSSVSQYLDVWTGAPGSQGAVEVLGHDAGTSTYTWTFDGYPPHNPPSVLQVVGRTPTNYDQVVFTLAVAPAASTFGGGSLAAPPGTKPATAPVSTTQPATVPGVSGYMVALDGTAQVASSRSNVSTLFYDHYLGSGKYYPGVATNQWHPHDPVGKVLAVAFGHSDAKAIVRTALRDLIQFYQVPSNRTVPVDMIGWSRGSFESVKLANLIASGAVHFFEKKRTALGQSGRPESVYADPVTLRPWVRYVGLISPVGQMGPEAGSYWPTSLPGGVHYMYQALDNRPEDLIYWETTMTAAVGTVVSQPPRYPFSHSEIGYAQQVLTDMENAGIAAGAPIS